MLLPVPDKKSEAKLSSPTDSKAVSANPPRSVSNNPMMLNLQNIRYTVSYCNRVTYQLADTEAHIEAVDLWRPSVKSAKTARPVSHFERKDVRP